MQDPHRKNRAFGRARATLVAVAAALVAGCQAISGLSDLEVQDASSTSGAGGGGGGGGGAPTTSTPASSATSSATTSSTSSTGGSASTSSSSASTGAGGEGGAACTIGSADACQEDNGSNGQCPPGHCSDDTCTLACDDGVNEMYCGAGMGPGATTSTGSGMPVTCGQPMNVRYACSFSCTASDSSGCSMKMVSCPNPTPANGFFPTCDVTCDGPGACVGTTVVCGNGPCVLHCLHGGCSGTTIQCGAGVCNVDSDMQGCPNVTVMEGGEACGPEVCTSP